LGIGAAHLSEIEHRRLMLPEKVQPPKETSLPTKGSEIRGLLNEEIIE